MFFAVVFPLCRRILLKPSYNSCGDEITCTNIFYKSCLTVLQTLLLAKLKRQIYFHCNYSKIFLVQQCFLPLFFFFVVGFYSKPSYKQLQWCSYLYKHDFAQVFSAVFPCILHFTTKRHFRQNLPLTCAWRDVQLQRQVPCTAKSQPFCTVYFLLAARSRFRPIAVTLFSLRQCPATRTLVCCF